MAVADQTTIDTDPDVDGIRSRDASDVSPPRRSRTVRTIAIVLLTAVTLGFAALAAVVVVQQLHFSRILSGSMTPTFSVGDVIITKPVPRSTLAVGDVVLLEDPSGEGVQYAHRIVSIDGSGAVLVVRTKGDANPVQDPWTVTVDTLDAPEVVASLPFSNLPSTGLGRTASLALLITMLASFAVVLVWPRRK